MSNINNYSIGLLFLKFLDFLLFYKNIAKKIFSVTFSEIFKKVNKDKEKDNLVEINSDKIKVNSIEAGIPLYSKYGNNKGIQNFRIYYINEQTK